MNASVISPATTPTMRACITINSNLIVNYLNVCLVCDHNCYRVLDELSEQSTILYKLAGKIIFKIFNLNYR